VAKVNDSLKQTLIKAQDVRKKQNEHETEFARLQKFETENKLKLKEYAKTINELKHDPAPEKPITSYKDALYVEMKKRGVDINDSVAIEEFMGTTDYIDAQSDATTAVNKANTIQAGRANQETGILLQKEQRISNICVSDPKSNFNPSDVIATAKAKGIYNNPNWNAQDLYNLHVSLHPKRQIHKQLNMIDERKVKAPFILKSGTATSSLNLKPLTELNKEEAKKVLMDKTDPRTIEFNKEYRKKK